MPRRIKFPQPNTDESKSIAITAAPLSVRANEDAFNGDAMRARQNKALPFFAVPLPNSRLLRITQAAQYLSATNWFMETLLRENEIPSLQQKHLSLRLKSTSIL